MGFPRQECWSGLSCLTPGDLSDLGMEPVFPALVGTFFTTEPPGKSKRKNVFICTRKEERKREELKNERERGREGEE